MVTRQDAGSFWSIPKPRGCSATRAKSCWDKRWKCCCPRRARRRHTKDRAAYLRHPGVRPMGTGLELYGRRKDGSEFPVDVSLSHLQTGGETLVSGFIRDITERKQSEERASHLASMIQAAGRCHYRQIDGWNYSELESWRRTTLRIQSGRGDRAPHGSAGSPGPDRRVCTHHEGTAPRQAYRTLRNHPAA